MYLHSRNVLHRDVKSPNVLVFDGGPWLFDGSPRRVAKLADFGLAVVKNELSTLATTSTAGTMNWKAPELFESRDSAETDWYKGRATSASDMYSFACVVYELVSGHEPWKGMSSELILRSILYDNVRPAKPTGCPEEVWTLIQRGWAQNPEQRPSFEDMLRRLEEIGRQGGVVTARVVQSTKRDFESMTRGVNESRTDTAIAYGERSDPMTDTTKSYCARGVALPNNSDDENILRSWRERNILRSWRERCSALEEMWPADASATTWEGVIFGEEADGEARRRVVEIVLNGSLGVATSVPPELCGLGGLKKLDLAHNRLTMVPPELGTLGALEELDLSQNRLASVPKELGSLGALKKLNLSRNQLTSVPSELGNLDALEELNLYLNLLTRVPAELGDLLARGGMVFKRDVGVAIMEHSQESAGGDDTFTTNPSGGFPLSEASLESVKLMREQIFERSYVTMWESSLLKSRTTPLRTVKNALLYAEMRDWVTKQFYDHCSPFVFENNDLIRERIKGPINHRICSEICKANRSDNLVCWADSIVTINRKENVEVACVCFVLVPTAEGGEEVGIVHLKFTFGPSYPYQPPLNLCVWKKQEAGGAGDPQRGEWHEYASMSMPYLEGSWSPAMGIHSWVPYFLARERINLHRQGCMHDASLMSHAELYHGGAKIQGVDATVPFQPQSPFLKELVAGRVQEGSMSTWLDFAQGSYSLIAAESSTSSSVIITTVYGKEEKFPLVEGDTLSDLKHRFQDKEGLSTDYIAFVVDGSALLADDPVTGTVCAALALVCGKPKRLTASLPWCAANPKG